MGPLQTYDPLSHTVSTLGSPFGNGVTAMGIESASSVPEPNTLSMFLGALLILLLKTQHGPQVRSLWSLGDARKNEQRRIALR